MNTAQIDAIISATVKINELKKQLNKPVSPEEQILETCTDGLEKKMNALLTDADKMADHYIELVKYIDTVNIFIENEIFHENKTHIIKVMQGVIRDVSVICNSEKN